MGIVFSNIEIIKFVLFVIEFVQKHEISPTKEGFGGWICLIFAKVLALDEIMTKQLRNEYLRKK